MMDFNAVRPQGVSQATMQSDYRRFHFKWFHHETVNYATPAVDIMDINVKPLSFFAVPSTRKDTQDTAACTLRLQHTAGKITSPTQGNWWQANVSVGRAELGVVAVGSKVGAGLIESICFFGFGFVLQV
jgi:biotin carboxyl carrier protein